VNPLTLLEADNLTLLKGSSLLLRHYQISIAAGQILHLTGDNGSGKTTLLQALAGLITPQGGTIRRHAPHRRTHTSLRKRLTTLSNITPNNNAKGDDCKCGRPLLLCLCLSLPPRSQN